MNCLRQGTGGRADHVFKRLPAATARATARNRRTGRRAGATYKPWLVDAIARIEMLCVTAGANRTPLGRGAPKSDACACPPQPRNPRGQAAGTGKGTANGTHCPELRWGKTHRYARLQLGRKGLRLLLPRSAPRHGERLFAAVPYGPRYGEGPSANPLHYLPPWRILCLMHPLRDWFWFGFYFTPVGRGAGSAV